MPPKRQVQAFNVLFDRADALQEFRRIALEAPRAGQLYALCAFSLLDPAEADRLAQRLTLVREQVLVFDSDSGSREAVAELVTKIRARKLGQELRKLRQEAEVYFQKRAG